MPSRRRLIVANWKMNTRHQSAIELAGTIAEWAGKQGQLPYDMVLCPPAQLLFTVASAVKGSPVKMGAQDCHWASHGPFTGDISAPQLADAGCQYVILGHSERRHGHGEKSELVARKLEAAQKAGLVPILCVGETAEQKEQGRAEDAVREYLTQSLPANYDPRHLVVSYEPVWAIGTGRQPAIEEIAHTNQMIRSILGQHGAETRILFGGSVAPSNAGAILASTEIDGVLIGSAGLSPEGYIGIATKANL